MPFLACSVADESTALWQCQGELRVGALQGGGEAFEGRVGQTEGNHCRAER